MAYKADTNTATLQILVDGISSPVSADVQGVKIIGGLAGDGTPVVQGGNGLASTPVGDFIVFGGVPCAISRAVLNGTAGGADQAIFAPASGKRAALLGLLILAGSAATTVLLTSKVGAGASTAVSPTYPLGAYGGLVLPFSGVPWSLTAADGVLGATIGSGGAAVIHALVASV